MPRSFSSATPSATSARIWAATALPSRILDTGFLEGREELRGDLLFAAHHARQVYDAVPDLRAEGPLDEVTLARAQQIGAPLDDVRDHERGEEVALALADELEGLEQLLLADQERRPDRLHLGDAHRMAGAGPVLLQVALHYLLGREFRNVRGRLEHPHPELLGVDVEKFLQVADDLVVARSGR